MAEYINRNALLESIRSGDGANEHKIFAALCVSNAPAADVAPRSEVAREIFEEIESTISPMLGLEDDKEYVAILGTTFAELKKKYTEPDAE